jgi:hypothetical protein
VGERLTVGPVAEASPPRVCAAGELTAVLVGSSSARQSIAFHADRKWHRPVEVPSTPVGSAAERGSPDPTARDREASGEAEGAEPVAREGEANEIVRDEKEIERETKRRVQALRDSADFGMIAMLSQGDGGDAPTVPWGRDDALGGRRPIFGDLAPARGDVPGEPAAALASARPHLPRQSFTCSADHATLTWRDASERIHQVRCTPDECERRSVTLALRPRSWWHATSIGGRTLILWRGAKGELRMRFDEIEKLPEARDVIVMDSAEYGGPEAVDLEVFTSDGGAVFWFRGLGFHALAIDAQGRHHAIGG